MQHKELLSHPLVSLPLKAAFSLIFAVYHGTLEAMAKLNTPSRNPGIAWCKEALRDL